MRNWTWQIQSERTPISWLRISFSSTGANALNLRQIVQPEEVPEFVLAAPNAVDGLGINKPGADFWVDVGSYPLLPFFKGSNYYGAFCHLVVTEVGVECQVYAGGLTPWRSIVTHLVASLVLTHNLQVEHWKVWAGSWDDPSIDVAQGNHEELLKYLELE